MNAQAGLPDFYFSFRLSLSTMEAAVIEYYAARFKKYTSQIVRGLVQRAAHDPATKVADLREFERKFEPCKQDPAFRSEVRESLSRLERRLAGEDVALTDATTRGIERRSSAWEQEFYCLRMTGFETFLCEYWAHRSGLSRESIVRHLIWELASSDPGFELRRFKIYVNEIASGKTRQVQQKLAEDIESLESRRKRGRL